MANKLKFRTSVAQRAFTSYINSDGVSNGIKVCRVLKKAMSGRKHIVLVDKLNRVLAVYRVQGSGSLRRLVNTPNEIATTIEPIRYMDWYKDLMMNDMLDPEYHEIVGKELGKP